MRRYKKRVLLCLSLGLILMRPAFAIDNPDTVDYIAKFTNKSQVYLNKIDDVTGYRATLIAYDDYYEFLNVELEDNYQMLLEQLPKEQRKSLELSQKNGVFFKRMKQNSFKINGLRLTMVVPLRYREGVTSVR